MVFGTMRMNTMDKIVTTKNLNHKRDKGRPSELFLHDLSRWHGELSSMELFQKSKDGDFWTCMGMNVYTRHLTIVNQQSSLFSLLTFDGFVSLNRIFRGRMCKHIFLNMPVIGAHPTNNITAFKDASFAACVHATHIIINLWRHLLCMKI